MDDSALFLSAARASRTLHQPWVEAPSSVRTFKEYIERIRRPSLRNELQSPETAGATEGHRSC